METGSRFPGLPQGVRPTGRRIEQYIATDGRGGRSVRRQGGKSPSHVPETPDRGRASARVRVVHAGARKTP